MLDNIATEVAVAAVASLVTFLGSTIWHKAIFKEMLGDALTTHEKIHHKDAMDEYVKKEFENHEKRCVACADFKPLKAAITFLVVKSGGNLSELGLDR